MTYWVHFKVDQLSSSQGNDHLPLIYGTAHNCLLSRGLPLVHTLICSDMANTIWVNLEKQMKTMTKIRKLAEIKYKKTLGRLVLLYIK